MSFPSAEHLDVSLADDLLTVTIRNPGRRNALDDAALAAFVTTVLSSRSPDFREGLAAFIEKRDPKFTGR